MNDELVIFGDEIKALGEGRIGGVLVRMTTDNDPDLTNDFFSAKSDIRFPETIDVYYNHGFDETLKKRVIGKAKLSRLDNADVWAETQLNMRDEYEKRIYEMAESGKLGYSSGALAHLVEREQVGKSFHIKTWVIGEASLTPTPAEFRNTVRTIKSIISEAGEPAQENNKMNDQTPDVKTAVDEAVKAALAQRDAELKAEADRQAAIQSAKDEGYQEAIKELKAKGAPAFNRITEPGFSEEKDAVPAFKHWMKTGQVNEGLIRPAGVWVDQHSTKAAMAIGAGATGGYLVPDPLYQQIVAKRDIASWVRQAPTQKFTTPADHLLVPVEDTSMTAFVSTNEAAAYNENEPTLAPVDMVLTKYTKLIKASEEFVNYEGTNFDSWLVDALARAEAATENTAASAVLVAGATSSGITTASPTAVTIPELASVAGSLGAGYEVSGQTGWLMKNASLWYLKGVFGTNYYSFDGLFNKPAWISDDLDAIAASKKPIFYGNWNFFGVIEKPGMMVSRNPWLYQANGQIGIFANIFRGFNVLQSEALVYLNTHA
mgnify:CR=1 FL=1